MGWNSALSKESQEFHHPTIINWVRESAAGLPEDEEDHPTIAELDELQTYVGRKPDKIWLWTAINHHDLGILAIEVGDQARSNFCKALAEN